MPKKAKSKRSRPKQTKQERRMCGLAQRVATDVSLATVELIAIAVPDRRLAPRVMSVVGGNLLLNGAFNDEDPRDNLEGVLTNMGRILAAKGIGFNFTLVTREA